MVLHLYGSDDAGNALFRQLGELWEAESAAAAVEKVIRDLDLHPGHPGDNGFVAIPEEHAGPIVIGPDGSAAVWDDRS